MECTEEGCGEEAILEVRYFDFVRFETIIKSLCHNDFKKHVKFVDRELKEKPLLIDLRTGHVQSKLVTT